MHQFGSANELAKAKAEAEFEQHQREASAADAQAQREQEYADAIAAHIAANDRAKELTATAVKEHTKIIADAISKFHGDVTAAVALEQDARKARINSWAALNPGARRSSELLSVPGGFPAKADHVVAGTVDRILDEQRIARATPHWSSAR